MKKTNQEKTKKKKKKKNKKKKKIPIITKIRRTRSRNIKRRRNIE